MQFKGAALKLETVRWHLDKRGLGPASDKYCNLHKPEFHVHDLKEEQEEQKDQKNAP